MKRLFLLIFIFILNYSSFSQVNLDKLGQSTMNFLLVGTSPKACATGEAFTVKGEGSEAIFYNPAGLADMSNQVDANISYTTWIADIKYLSGGLAYNLGNYGVVGLSLLTVDYGTIYSTSLLTASEQSSYPLGYKDNGTMKNIGAYYLGFSYAKRISDRFAIGGNIKIAGQNLGENFYTDGSSKINKSVKLVFDAGVKFNSGFKSFAFGMSIRNFSSVQKREMIEEQLPLIFTLGAGMNLLDLIDEKLADNHRLEFGIDMLHLNNFSERINIGVDYRFMNMISLRGGYQTNRSIGGLSFGAGLNHKFMDYDVEVNYSFSKMDIFSVNRIALVFAF